MGHPYAADADLGTVERRLEYTIIVFYVGF